MEGLESLFGINEGAPVVESKEKKPIDAAPNKAEEKNAGTEVDAIKRENEELKNTVKKLDSYAPMVQMLEKDPEFMTHVTRYFDGDKRGMELPEDFEFDAKEAFANPASDSAKAMSSLVQREAQKIVQERDAILQQTVKEKEMDDTLRSKFKLNQTQIEEVKNYAKKKQYTIEDVYFLMQKDQGVVNEKRTIEGKGKKETNTAFPVTMASTPGADELEQNLDTDEAFGEAFGKMLQQSLSGGFQ